MLNPFVSMSCRAGLVASAFVFGLFLNSSGRIQPVEAFNIKIKQPNPIQHMYFNGYTKPSGHGREIPFVARLTYDIRAKNVKQGRARAYGEYAIKEFVFTTKYQYSRVPGGSIKIYKFAKPQRRNSDCSWRLLYAPLLRRQLHHELVAASGYERSSLLGTYN